MPEQWEHMAVTGRIAAGSWGIEQIWPDGRVAAVEGAAGVLGFLDVANRLGREGWAIASTDEAADGPYYGRTIWLRRRIE